VGRRNRLCSLKEMLSKKKKKGKREGQSKTLLPGILRSCNLMRVLPHPGKKRRKYLETGGKGKGRGKGGLGSCLWTSKAIFRVDRGASFAVKGGRRGLCLTREKQEFQGDESTDEFLPALLFRKGWTFRRGRGKKEFFAGEDPHSSSIKGARPYPLGGKRKRSRRRHPPP